MAVYSRIRQTAILVSFEFIDSVIHQDLIEHIKTYQQRKVLFGEPRDTLEQFRFQLQDDVFQRILAEVRQIHEDRDACGKLHQLLLYLAPLALDFLFSIAQFFLFPWRQSFDSDIFVLVAKCYVKLSFITKSTFCLAMKYKIVNFAAE